MDSDRSEVRAKLREVVQPCSTDLVESLGVPLSRATSDDQLDAAIEQPPQPPQIVAQQRVVGRKADAEGLRVTKVSAQRRGYA